MDLTQEQREAIREPMQTAIAAQVRLYNALSAVESALGCDCTGLDEALQGLAFDYDEPEEVKTEILTDDFLTVIFSDIKEEK